MTTLSPPSSIIPPPIISTTVLADRIYALAYITSFINGYTRNFNRDAPLEKTPQCLTRPHIITQIPIYNNILTTHNIIINNICKLREKNDPYQYTSQIQPPSSLSTLFQQYYLTTTETLSLILTDLQCYSDIFLTLDGFLTPIDFNHQTRCFKWSHVVCYCPVPHLSSISLDDTTIHPEPTATTQMTGILYIMTPRHPHFDHDTKSLDVTNIINTDNRIQLCLKRPPKPIQLPPSKDDLPYASPSYAPIPSPDPKYLIPIERRIVELKYHFYFWTGDNHTFLMNNLLFNHALITIYNPCIESSFKPIEAGLKLLYKQLQQQDDVIYESINGQPRPQQPGENILTSEPRLSVLQSQSQIQSSIVYSNQNKLPQQQNEQRISSLDIESNECDDVLSSNIDFTSNNYISNNNINSMPQHQQQYNSLQPPPQPQPQMQQPIIPQMQQPIIPQMQQQPIIPHNNIGIYRPTSNINRPTQQPTNIQRQPPIDTSQYKSVLIEMGLPLLHLIQLDDVHHPPLDDQIYVQCQQQINTLHTQLSSQYSFFQPISTTTQTSQTDDITANMRICQFVQQQMALQTFFPVLDSIFRHEYNNVHFQPIKNEQFHFNIDTSNNNIHPKIPKHFNEWRGYHKYTSYQQPQAVISIDSNDF